MLMRAWTATLTGALTLGLVVVGQLGGTADARPRSTAVTKTATTTLTSTTTTTSTTGWTYKALTSPARVQVSDATGVLATLTVGARTVTMRGAARTFAERLGRLVPVPVELFDERFTTRIAARGGGSASEDSRAAAVLLEDWLARHA